MTPSPRRQTGCSNGAGTILLGLALLAATPAAAQSVTLKLGTGSPFALERAFKTVLIGDPSVVSVNTRGDRSVMLEPLNSGATNVVFVDDRSIAIANVRVLVCAPGAIRISYQDVPGCD
jgi:Flp pilus assembly secretin CpaC